jgi:hypothetical protein
LAGSLGELGLEHGVGFGGGGVEEEGADGVEVFGLAADVLADGLDVAEVGVEGGFAGVDGGGAEGVAPGPDGVAGAPSRGEITRRGSQPQRGI